MKKMIAIMLVCMVVMAGTLAGIVAVVFKNTNQETRTETAPSYGAEMFPETMFPAVRGSAANEMPNLSELMMEGMSGMESMMGEMLGMLAGESDEISVEVPDTDDGISGGSLNYKGMTIRFAQVTPNTVILYFSNPSSYRFNISSQGNAFWGFTVYAFDAEGNASSCNCRTKGFETEIEPYVGSLAVRLQFDGLTSPVSTLKIPGVSYRNMENHFDNGYSQLVEVKAN